MSKTALEDRITVTIEETSPCARRVEIAADAATVDEFVKEALKEFRHHAQIPGFRQGKAPVHLVASRFAKEAEDEAARNIISTGYEKVMDDDTLDIISYSVPRDDARTELKKGQGFSFNIDLELAPAIELPDYKSVKVEVPEQEVADQEIDNRIARMKEAKAEYRSIDGPVEKGDMLKVSYTSDFELPEDASPSLKSQAETDDGWIWLNEPELFPGAIENLTGIVKDGEKTFISEIPDDFRIKEMAGKKVTYDLKVLDIQRKVVAESDEVLFESFGVESSAELREAIKTGMKLDMENRRQAEIRSQLIDKICDAVAEFPLPEKALANQTASELRAIVNNIVKSEEDADKFTKDIEAHKAEAGKAAEKRLRRFLILRAIANQEDIAVEESEINDHLNFLSRYYGHNAKDLQRQMEESGGIDELRMDMLMAKVTTHLTALMNADKA